MRTDESPLESWFVFTLLKDIGSHEDLLEMTGFTGPLSAFFKLSIMR